MENEKHFSQNIEQPEHEPKTYVVRFDESHFGDEEIDPNVVRNQAESGSSWIPQSINEWWSKICSESNLNPSDKKLEKILLHLIEVARNAFEKVGSGEIKVIFEPKKITFEVADKGQGFGNQEDVEYLTSSQYGHGLSQARRYSDEFLIETNEKKYAKAKGKGKLVNMGVSDITTGSKITFIKNFE
jgi:anti-sigma regulatory factor (Ser/Thr protein kinase)